MSFHLQLYHSHDFTLEVQRILGVDHLLSQATYDSNAFMLRLYRISLPSVRPGLSVYPTHLPR